MTETEAADAPGTVTIAGLHGQLVTFPADSEALRGGFHHSQVEEGDDGGVEAGGEEGHAESEEDDDHEGEEQEDGEDAAGDENQQQPHFEPVLPAAHAGAAVGNGAAPCENQVPIRGARSALPDAHHAAINRRLEAELEDLRNTLAVMQYNQTTQQQIEKERDELRQEVSALRDEIQAFRSGTHTIDGPDDVDDPRINMDRLPKVDGKIHIPTSLSDDEAFAKNALAVYVGMITAGPAKSMQFYPDWPDLVPLMVRRYVRLGVCKDLYYFVAGGDKSKEDEAMDKIANKRQTMNKTMKLYGCGAGGGVANERWHELERVGLRPTEFRDPVVWTAYFKDGESLSVC
ncbi:unnamed protein product [Closterium sp. NIES-64]|nr:unnamed protein product [Closterium sp. NIES-64]